MQESRPEGGDERSYGRVNQLLEAALGYGSSGWVIFPLRGKLPAIYKAAGGKGYLDATADLDCIRSWWKSYPYGNIGIATRASDLLVLDVDPRHGGDQRLAELEVEYGPLPVTLEVVSGGSGRHIYFRAPEVDAIERKANALGEGLDLPNYVVAPPSVHPEIHRAYTWAQCSHSANIAIAEAPRWLLDLLVCAPKPQPIEHTRPTPGWLSLVYSAIITRINAGGGRLRAQSNGGMMGRCPLHEDRTPSFSIHPEKGWKCFAGCGEGRLTSLAVNLGLSII